MKPLKKVTELIIDVALEVHRAIGPGLPKETYEAALCHEFGLRRIPYVRQPACPAVYKGRTVGEYRPDLIVDDRVVLDVASVEYLDPVFEARLRTHVWAASKKAGLLINFSEPLLLDGIRRCTR